MGALSSTSFVSPYTVRRSKVNHNCLLIDTPKRLTVGPLGAARHQVSWLESCLESQNGILIPARVVMLTTNCSPYRSFSLTPTSGKPLNFIDSISKKTSLLNLIFPFHFHCRSLIRGQYSLFPCYP